MVAIVSGARTGLELGSWATLGSTGLSGQAVAGRNGQGVYVNVANGNLVVQQQDDRLMARGEDASALRTYNSRGVVDDDADNWMSGVESLRLAGTLNTAGSTITRIGRDGSSAQYAYDTATSSYLTTEGDGAYDRIRYVSSDSQYEWTDGASGITQRYEGSGAWRLLSCRDPAGNTLNYSYGANGFIASISTSNGDTLFYDYTAANLTQVRAVSGGVTTTRVGYGYDTSNRLLAVKVDLSPADNATADANVYQTQYTYEGSSKRISRITQGDGSSLSFSYVDAGAGMFMVSSITDALNQVTAFSYTVGLPGVATSTVVTDARGQVTRYDFDASGRVTSIMAPPVNGGGPRQQFAYNARGDVSSITDGEGRAVVFEYDTNGNQVLQRDAAGNTVARSFDARNQLLTETRYAIADPDGAGAALPAGALATRYIYDAAGRNQLRFVLTAEGRVTEHRYDGFGQRVASISYEVAYPVGPLSATSVPLEGAMATWSASGAQPGQRVDFAYDARGQLQTRTTYSRVTSAGDGVADGAQSVERLVYDSAGLLLQTVSAVNGTSTNTYDGLGRVVTSTNALGQTTLTRYTDAGRATALTFANGLISTSTYDLAGRLVSVLQSSAAGNLGETKYAYDSLGRLVMTTDPTGLRSYVLYDAAGRKTADIDANGTMVEYRYDRSGLLAGSTAWGTAVTTALVDVNGVPTNPSVDTVRPAASGNDVTGWNQYDAAGRLVRTAQQVGTGARAAVTETRYDGLSRVVQVLRYAMTIPADGSAGAAVAGTVPLPATSADDRITRQFYDGDGRVAGTLDGEGFLVTFQYNSAGQLAERLAYATATTSALRATGTLAQLVPATSANDTRSVTLYDGKGQVIGEVDAEGYLTESVYDAAGRVTLSARYASRVPAAVSITSTVAAVRPNSSAADRATARVYDLLGRLTQETSPENVVTQYAYDIAGNLVSTTRAAGTAEVRTVTARHDAQGRLTGELTGEGTALLTGGQTQAQVDAIWSQYGLQHSYDAAGRRTSTRDPLGRTTWFYYDADGALRYTINALGEVRENRYDDRGRLTQQLAYVTRIATRGPGGVLSSPLAVTASAQDAVTTIGYNRDGTVATQTDADGNVTTHAFNAFGDKVGSTRPLSAGVSLAESYTVDRLGRRTTRASDAAGADVIVSTSYDAFGRVVRTVDGMGNARDPTYDRLGRTVTARDAMGGIRSTSYDAFDRVLTETNELGAVTAYAYDSVARSLAVTTAEGIRTTTVRNRTGEIQSITDGNGNVTSYAYDRDGQLLSTATPLTTTSSRYDNAGHAIETTDANGNKVAYTYDAADRVLTRRVDPTGLNLTTTYAYDGRGQQVTVVDPNGVTTSYQYQRSGRVARKTVDPAGLNLQTSYSHDANGNVLTVTTPGGTLTQYVYDALGRRVQEKVDPGGLNLVRSWVYDKSGNVTSSTDARGLVTRYAYDVIDRLVFTVDPLGAVTQVAYDAAGRVTKTISYSTAISTAGLGAVLTAAQVQARLVSQPMSDLQENRVYDKDDRVVATVDGAGGVVRFTYDGNGNVRTRIAYSKAITFGSWTPGSLPAPVADTARDTRLDTVYDALNHAVYTMDGIGAVVSQRFDGNGQLLERIAYAATIPLTTATTASALATAAAAVAVAGKDALVRYTYDAAGRRTWEVDGTGAVTKQQYDANSNVVQQTFFATAVAAGGAAPSVVASASDRIFSRAYDAANRMVFEVDPLNAVTEHVFDADGHVTREIAYSKTIATLPSLGAAGSAAAVRSALQPTPAADRSRRFSFNAAGRQEFAIDAEGAVAELRYDASGRVVQRTAYANVIDASGLSSTASASAVRALVSVSPGVDRTTGYAYDAGGRLVAETDAVGTVRASQYDAIGRLLSYGIATREETYGYDAAGRRTKVRDALGWEDSYTYDGLGNTLTFKNKLNATWTYDYDAAGHRVSEQSPPVITQEWSTRYVLSGLSLQPVRTLTTYPLLPVTTWMVYDALGHLTQRTEAAARESERTTRYEYDAAGRQVRVIFPPVGVYAAGRDSLANVGSGRVEDTRSLETRTVYDTLGNAVANIDVGGALSQKVYDRSGGVVYEVDALGYVTRYGRDAFGGVSSLVRYAAGTTLASRTVVQASDAASKASVDQAVSAPGFDHTQDRTIQTFFDRAGRVTEVWQPESFVYDESQGGGFVGRARTRTIYNAFGDAREVSTARNAGGTEWLRTTHFFDLAGRSTDTVDAMGYLTQREFDPFGNLVRQTDRATSIGTSGWTLVAGRPQHSASTDDRVVSYTYDPVNRRLTEKREQVTFSYGLEGATSAETLVTTAYGYDAVGNQVLTRDALGNVTLTRYDAMGWVTSIAGPLPERRDGMNAPYTVFDRDAFGNVLRRTDYAHGVTRNPDGSIVGPRDGVDARVSSAEYDRLGRKILSVDGNGAQAFTSYDAFGHAAKTWQVVTDVDGVTRTAFQVSTFDALGQTLQIATPASHSVVKPVPNAVLTQGSWVGESEIPSVLSLAWPATLLDGAGGTVRVEADLKRTDYDEYGTPIISTRSAAQDYPTSSISGVVDLAYSSSLGNIAQIRILQRTSALGPWVTRWKGTLAEADGGSIGTVATTADVVQVNQRFNAFGELTSRGAAGGSQEYLDYDTAGRLWRTNAGDGVDRVRLYDLQGYLTAEIRSAGSTDLKSFASASAASMGTGTLRTDFTVDALGRVARRAEPTQKPLQGSATALSQQTSAAITRSVPVGDEFSPPSVMNEISLTWKDISQLGSGDVRVTLEYLSPIQTGGGYNDAESGVWVPVFYAGGVTGSYTSAPLDSSQSAKGAQLKWTQQNTSTTIGTITRIWVEKRNINDDWRTVIDQRPGQGHAELDIVAAADTRFTKQWLEYRPAGSTLEWTPSVMECFGEKYRFDASQLAPGSYEYRVGIQAPGDPSTAYVSDGTLTVTMPPLTAISGLSINQPSKGILSWDGPARTKAQSFRFRPAGSGGAWTTLPAAPYNTTTVRDGVDLTNVATGTYDFELVWTSASTGVPEAHARGTFGITKRVLLGTSYGLTVTTLPGSPAVSTVEGSILVATMGRDGVSAEVRPTVQQTWDRWGNLLEMTDPRNNAWKTTYRYNAWNKMVRQEQPDSGGGVPTTDIYYDALGRQIAVRNARGYLAAQSYDALGNIVQERHADGASVTSTFNGLSLKVSTTDALGGITDYKYDGVGQLLELTKPQVELARLASDYSVQLTSGVRLKESWTYDELGRRKTYSKGDGAAPAAYWYDLRGNLVASQQVGGSRWRAVYDLRDRKVAEWDGGIATSSWKYDYFGQLQEHVDLGGARYTYTYNAAHQLTKQTNTRKQSLTYTYDEAGQLTRIQDSSDPDRVKITTYAYDLGGRRLRERTEVQLKTGERVVYQDNHLAYDAMGNLRDVADARVHMQISYDLMGNRTSIVTAVDYMGRTATQGSSTSRTITYDAMNRQSSIIVADPNDVAGKQNHSSITYDANGNRKTDTFWADDRLELQTVVTRVLFSTRTTQKYVKVAGFVTEGYSYDGLNRLTTTVRDGITTDSRQYDGADRVVRSGPSTLPATYMEAMGASGDVRLNRYGADGRLLHQRVQTNTGGVKADISWDPLEGSGSFASDGYDGAGNVRSYVVNDYSANATTKYANQIGRFERYANLRTDGSSTRFGPGTLTQNYDANGYLVSVADATASLNNRTFTNDATGKALFVNQAGNVQRQLIVNGEVLGIYGVGVQNGATAVGANPNFAEIADFNFSYAAITRAYPAPTPGTYRTGTGDSLESIARAAYGDSSLWYLIADANGLRSKDDLKVGQALTIPNRVTSSHNDSGTFLPYDPTRITGDLTPNMPLPTPSHGGCGAFGQILMIVVAIVVTYYTSGTMTAETLELEAAVQAGAVSSAEATGLIFEAGATAMGSDISVAMAASAAGSAAGQIVGLATGTIDDFSFREIALAAISGGVSAGLGPSAFGGDFAGTMARGLTASALTQGISVAVGLQDRFSWRSVAAAGIGAGAGYAAGQVLNQLGAPTTFEGALARRTARSLAAGVATLAARGGRVDMTRVAVDAFGNALGYSLAEAATGDSSRVMGAGPRGERSPPSLIDLEEASVVAGPMQDRPSPTTRFTAAWSGILTATQTGAPEWATPTQQQQSSELYQKSLGEMKEVLEYTAQNSKLRDALLSRYGAWMQEGGWVKPPMVQNAMVAFGTLIGEPTPESAVALSMAMSGSHGIRTSPEAMGGLLGMLALRNDPDRVTGNLDQMARSSVVYDGTAYNSFQFGAVKANALDVAGALIPWVPGLAMRGATLAGRIAMAAGGALVNGVNFLAQATLGTTGGRAAIMSVALRTAQVTGLPAPVPGVGIYSSLRGAAAANPAVEPISPATSNTTHAGVIRRNDTDMRQLRDLWDDLGYGEILSKTNRDLIAQGRRPHVDDAWIKVFPEDAGLMGDKISPHHIAGLPVTVPWPKTRHIDAHMPGGFRYHPGGPGAAVPFYPARQSGVTQ